jgi:hypothetical protein
LDIVEFVEYSFLFNLSVIEEQVKGALAKWNHMLENVPKDTFSEWSSRE